MRCIRCSISLFDLIPLLVTLENAQNTIRVLNQNPANQRLTFLAPAWTTFFNDPLVFTNGEFPVSYLEGTIGVIPVHGNTTAFTNYFYGLNPENNNYPLFIEYWQTAFRCFYNSTDMSIPLCVPNISLRTYPLACRCDGTESTSELSIDVSLYKSARDRERERGKSLICIILSSFFRMIVSD